MKEQLRTYVDSNPDVVEIFKLKRIGDKTFILKPRKNTFLTILLGFVKEEIDPKELIITKKGIKEDGFEYELISQYEIIRGVKTVLVRNSNDFKRFLTTE